MVKSMTSGVAGLRSHQTRMDVIGNNIANVNTYGFKSSRVMFRDALYQTTAGSSDATMVFGGGNATQIGYGSQVGSIDVMHVRGSYSPTDYPTDCMINGNGYYIVGPKSAGYNSDDVYSLELTRVGAFVFDGDGNFVDTNRNCVYGFLPMRDAQGNLVKPDTDPASPPGSTVLVGPNEPAYYDTSKVVPIVLPVIGGAQAVLTQIRIGGDGKITGVDNDGKPIEVGTIALANVPNPSALEMTSMSYYKARANTGEVLASIPGSNTTGQIQSGGLEMSTVDLAKEFTDMITCQRGYQANTRIITVTDEMLQELVNIKR